MLFAMGRAWIGSDRVALSKVRESTGFKKASAGGFVVLYMGIGFNSIGPSQREARQKTKREHGDQIREQ